VTDAANNRCPECYGAGYHAALSFSLGICTRCNGTGCAHHASQKTDGHCALCEQDGNCKACHERGVPPKPTEVETFDPDALADG
jgi:DnaJ-class molecular chaperone